MPMGHSTDVGVVSSGFRVAPVSWEQAMPQSAESAPDLRSSLALGMESR